jgi:hypothetical protein
LCIYADASRECAAIVVAPRKTLKTSASATKGACLATSARRGWHLGGKASGFSSLEILISRRLQRLGPFQARIDTPFVPQRDRETPCIVEHRVAGSSSGVVVSYTVRRGAPGS